MTEELKVHFRHPRQPSRRLTAVLSPDCTGQDAIDGLVAGDGQRPPFLGPPPEGSNYKLAVKRGNLDVEITPNMSFAQAGIVSGDEIHVSLDYDGA